MNYEEIVYAIPLYLMAVAIFVGILTLFIKNLKFRKHFFALPLVVVCVIGLVFILLQLLAYTPSYSYLDKYVKYLAAILIPILWLTGALGIMTYALIQINTSLKNIFGKNSNVQKAASIQLLVKNVIIFLSACGMFALLLSVIKIFGCENNNETLCKIVPDIGIVFKSKLPDESLY
ncbi:MAG: hypothetical protein U0525_04160 [Patescibacteria group bacterium]